MRITYWERFVDEVGLNGKKGEELLEAFYFWLVDEGVIS